MEADASSWLNLRILKRYDGWIVFLAKEIPMINKDVVKHIADLSRLSLSDAEVESFTHQLGPILSYVEHLDKIDTSGVEPTAFIAPAHDPLRDDMETPSLSPEMLLANGPKVTLGHFAVPKVIRQ
jgi:aspartyl-tRNA(Asn)/glutamyl-tRNA(Gln) amidotransferase subunit C